MDRLWLERLCRTDALTNPEALANRRAFPRLSPRLATVRGLILWPGSPTNARIVNNAPRTVAKECMRMTERESSSPPPRLPEPEQTRPQKAPKPPKPRKVERRRKGRKG